MDLTGVLHVDWFTVSQVHEDAPYYGADWVVWHDPTTMEVKRTQMYGAQVAGSYESSCRVRCINGRVEFSGNPSKWNRLESVSDGCTTLAQALAVASSVVQSCGLPAFEPRPPAYGAVGQSIRSVGACSLEPARTGPRLSRIDIAGCYILGGPAEVAAYTQWAEGQGLGRRGQRMVRKGDCSVKGGTERRRILAIYGKGSELMEALGHWRRKRVGDVDFARAYLTELSARAEAGGWMRREVRLGCDYLSETGLCWFENWQEEGDMNGNKSLTLAAEFGKLTLAGERCNVGAVTDWRTDVSARLIAKGLSARAVTLRLGLLASWMAGFLVGPDVSGLSRASWYRYVRDLQEAAGVDLRQPPNVVSLGVRCQQAARPVQARMATADDVRRLYAGLREVA